MCTNQREIVNKYTGHKLYVKCGHCPACMQEKAAHRVSRIKAQDSPDLECVMVTLTYRRNDAPFVYRDEAYWFSQGMLGYSDLKTKSFHPYNLNVYRMNNYRKVRVSDDYKTGYKNIGRSVLCDIEPLYNSDNHRRKIDFRKNKDLAHLNNRIGVCYYPDVQEFVARLRINLNRHYDFTETFKAFCCSEYGAKSLRPHFHLLFWIPKGTFSTFRSAIVESWPYGDLQKFERTIEKAFRASSYVASYVNCSSDFPDFLKTFFKPKHSYSKDFGCNHPLFSLQQVLSKFERGSLSYFKQIDKQGKPCVIECPYPKYVISRYFPRFKGYNRVNLSQICNLMERFRQFPYGEKSNLTLVSPKLDLINFFAFPVYYSNEDAYKISIRLNNAFDRFRSLHEFGSEFSFDDYCILHQKIWRLYDSTILRLHLVNDDIPFYEKYDNLEEIKCKYYDSKAFGSSNVYFSDCDSSFTPREKVDYQLPVGFNEVMLLVTNPNDFRSVRATTALFESSFHEHIKHRSVNNAVLSSIYEEF